ncbi:hypothetical protein [Corynebacterium bouchesdurhonense]|uniref:hypothetical protein n=1 Tax=Corynebacterium bouchesdurhonense TaxID=1720192 RepID=UPI00082DF959|nr:hypothetical protein [Corynebacterium bouchesdurhonense]
MITGKERQRLIDIAATLEVDATRIRSLIDEPQAPTSPTQFTLSPGDRVAFTGSLDIPYEIWAQRAAAARADLGCETLPTMNRMEATSSIEGVTLNLLAFSNASSLGDCACRRSGYTWTRRER